MRTEYLGGLAWPGALPGSASYWDLPSGDLQQPICTKGQGEGMAGLRVRQLWVHSVEASGSPSKRSRGLSI